MIDVDDDLDTSDLFRGALAMGLVRSVETIARRHIDQSYEVYRRRLQIIRADHCGGGNSAVFAMAQSNANFQSR